MKTILVDAWNTFITEDGINQDIYALLETFPNPKIILTNANEEERKNLGMINMPYEIFSLSHNPNKPDPIYYKTMLEHFSVEANNVIYFEHNIDAVHSAESVGILTYHYNYVEKDIVGVKVFLESNV